jgi:5'-nucleotidase
VRILVTNDDGIDSLGLHALANAMRPHGDVTVVAPASEYSGAGASLGTLTFDEPTARPHDIEALDGLTTWSVSGPPALCVLYAQLGSFGEPFDLVVSGINPGQNVGWSVYHSGTIGAALTGRNRGASGLAMSIGFSGNDVEGQTWSEIVEGMLWDSAATIASKIVEGMIATPTPTPTVINCNVPNKPLHELEGWKVGRVGSEPPRKLVTGKLVPDDPDELGEVFKLSIDWGAAGEALPGTDAWLVRNDAVSVTWLGDLAETTPDAAQHGAVAAGLDGLLGASAVE